MNGAVLGNLRKRTNYKSLRGFRIKTPELIYNVDESFSLNRVQLYLLIYFRKNVPYFGFICTSLGES